MPALTPPDRRPYRAAHEPGDELSITAGGTTIVFRQIGWHGQSGAFYALGEDPSKHEPGSFSPLWIIAHCDVVPVDDETDAVVNAMCRREAARPRGGV